VGKGTLYHPDESYPIAGGRPGRRRVVDDEQNEKNRDGGEGVELSCFGLEGF
jgi:hypothetical protein